MKEGPYRDITIKFMDIEQHCQVSASALVSNYFFTPAFPSNHQPYFQLKAHQLKLTTFRPLSQLTHYDVRLNSTKPNASVRNAQIDFATYPPTKRLCFYLIDQTPIQQGKTETTDCFVEFQLILGNSVERSQSINVKGLNGKELHDTLKQMFYLQKTQPIRLIDQKANITLALAPNELPQKKFRALKLNKIGVIREYTAG